MTLQKLPFRKTTRCLCLNICAAELKPLVGALQSGATGYAEDLPGKIGAYGESKNVLQGGAFATLTEGECTTLCDEGNMLQVFGHGDNFLQHISHAIKGVDCYISPVEVDTQINVIETMFTRVGKT